MAVKIRLKRLGKIRVPQYRIVIVDSRKKRDGKVIEEIGLYRPKEEPSFIEISSERAQYWLGVGAQPSDTVTRLLSITGDWQKFKGLGGTEGRLKVKEPKRDKLEIFNEALKDADQEPKAEAVTAKKKADKAEKADEKVEVAPVADTEKADADKAEESEKTEKSDAATDGGYGPDSAAPLEDDSAPEGFDIKGNKDSMKFHAPSSPWYGRTKAEVWFKTAEAAEAAGFVNAESKSDEA